MAKQASKQVMKAKKSTSSVMASAAKKAQADKPSVMTKGKVDKDVVMQATTMTKAEWDKFQGPEMDKEWPLPSYMNSEKGHTKFKSETYELLIRWTASTEIRYRPHAKSPGSKSSIRYESYAAAKTVGEALKFGSYPADWCWDYERGFIKFIGGPVRDEPLDIAKAREAGSEVTEVDLAINTWYRRELARQLGIKVEEIGDSAGWGESLQVRGNRLLAQKEAKERLERADKTGTPISDEDVLWILKRWAFFKNPWRQNVMKEGQDYVFSDTLGLLRDRQGDIHLTSPTRRYPQVAELIARWLTDRLPEEAKSFKFTGMNLNCNYAGRLHRDNGNFGPSFIKAFGSFTGGELVYYPEDRGGALGALESAPPADMQKLDLQKNLLLFNGNLAHSVTDFSGERFSVVYFTTSSFPGISEEDRGKLERMGFPVPAKDEDPFSLLRPPKGYPGQPPPKVPYPQGAGKTSDVTYRLWTGAAIEGTKKSSLTSPKQRLEPENARSFYNAAGRQMHKYGCLKEDAKDDVTEAKDVKKSSDLKHVQKTVVKNAGTATNVKVEDTKTAAQAPSVQVKEAKAAAQAALSAIVVD